jgi:hypothetical protein
VIGWCRDAGGEIFDEFVQVEILVSTIAYEIAVVLEE